MDADLFIADLQKSFAEARERFRKPIAKSEPLIDDFGSAIVLSGKEKTVQILKQPKAEPKIKKEYAGIPWYPEEKIHQLKKQAEAEKLESALNSLTNSQVAEVVKAVNKRPSVANLDYWYNQPTGIFI